MVGAVVEVTSLSVWKELLSQGSSGRAAVAFFWADWHEPSKRGGQMDAVVCHLAEAHGSNALFLKVEAEAVPEVAVKFNIAVVPTFVFLLGGGESSHVVDRLEGAHPGELAKKIQALVALPAPPTPAAAAAQDSSSTIIAGRGGSRDLNERLKSLVSAAPVVLFMKGSPSEPRCGFSRQMVEVLKGQGVSFASFDILKDDEVRQGLKLYVRGELVGGLDIIKEMVAASTPLAQQLGLTTTSQEGGAAGQQAIRDNNDEGPQQQQAGSGSTKAESLEGRLKRLVVQAPVMLFMKGSPDAPRCGFSASIVELLKTEGVDFGSFDILKDEEVRQGLKAFSQWPTYPQLYAGGELVGGLDIVKEMVQQGSGGLAAQLKDIMGGATPQEAGGGEDADTS